MEHKLLIIPIFSGVHLAQSLVLCVLFVVLFFLVIVLSVLLRIITCDYPFDMFKLFLKYMDLDKSVM
jgi:hypothetical protein